MSKEKATIIAATIAGFFACAAAVIGLGLPIVSRLTDRYLPAITPTPVIVVQGQITQVAFTATFQPTVLTPTVISVAPTSLPIQFAQPTQTFCAAAISRADVQNWAKVGLTDKAIMQTYITEFKDKLVAENGFVSGFHKGDTIPAGILIATDFGNGESEDYLSFPVNPIVHYRSWGLFEVMASFVAPNANGGWCATIH